MKVLPMALALAALLLADCVLAQSTENILQRGDSIVVKLTGVPAEDAAAISNNYNISDNGTINLPYIGEVKAVGQRPSELQKSIESAYKSGQVFTHPTILVSTDKLNPTQFVCVSGEVKVPNRHPMSNGMTTFDAITSASGPTEWGDMKRVKFCRDGKTRELDLRRLDNPDSKIQVQPGDRIHVSR